MVKTFRETAADEQLHLMLLGDRPPQHGKPVVGIVVAFNLPSRGCGAVSVERRQLFPNVIEAVERCTFAERKLARQREVVFATSAYYGLGEDPPDDIVLAHVVEAVENAAR